MILSLIPLCAALAAQDGAPAPEKVRFRTADGVSIAALYQPPAKNGAVVLLVHGVAAGKGEWDPLAQALWPRGVGTLAIDLRKHGDNAKAPNDWQELDLTRGWASCLNDLEGALAFLQKKGIPPARVGAVGGSIGANLVSRLAAKHPDLKFAALLSPGMDYRGVTPAKLKGRRVLVAASPPDAYADQTAKELAKRDGARLLEGVQGHGAQLLRDPAFLNRLLDWISPRPVKRAK